MARMKLISLWKVPEAEREAFSKRLQSFASSAVTAGASSSEYDFCLVADAAAPLLEKLEALSEEFAATHTTVQFEPFAPAFVAPPVPQSAPVAGTKRTFNAMSMPFQVVKKEIEPVEKKEVKRDRTNQVFIGNLAYKVTEEDLWTLFQERGLPEPSDIHVMRNPSGLSRGAALVTFETLEAARKATELNDTDFVLPGEPTRKMRVNMSDERPERPERPPREAKQQTAPAVIVKNLAFNATEANIGELFAGIGEIKEVRIAKDRRTSRSRGFAIVEFTHSGALQKALLRNNREVRGRAVRIEIVSSGADAPAFVKGEVLPAEAPAVSETGPVETAAEVKVEVEGAAVEAKNETVEAAPVNEEVVEPPAKIQKIEEEADEEELDLSLYSSADELVEKVHPKKLTKVLQAKGLKSGGTPMVRAVRLMKYGSMPLEEVPHNELLPRKA